MPSTTCALAGETITATRKTMAEYDAELDPEYRQQLNAALDEVEAVLSLENPKTKTGDPARLKAATAQLDEVTKPLADHAMDMVMEAMLRKKGLLPPETPPEKGPGSDEEPPPPKQPPADEETPPEGGPK
jgi:hypothetical protein